MITVKFSEYGYAFIDVYNEKPTNKELIEMIQELESKGYEFDGTEYETGYYGSVTDMKLSFYKSSKKTKTT